MPQDIRLWTVGNGSPSTLKQTPLDLESRLEDWLAADISLISDDLLLIGRQVATDFGGSIDLLCIDPQGDLTVLELKRDRTPRHVVAQVLDYATWASELSHDRITEIASAHYEGREAFERAFKQSFGSGLPDTLNSAHRLLVVASETDAASERIIEYLSGQHGVNINAVTFQYFDTEESGELLARVFLMEPEAVDYQAFAKGSSKRKPNLTYEQLNEIADENGVGDVYRTLFDRLVPLFDGKRRTRSSVSFTGDFRESRSAMINLIPTESSPSEGLAFNLYALRVAERFGLPEEEIPSLLPDGIEPWSYQDAGPEWEGYTGHLKKAADLEPLLEAIDSR